MDSLNLKMDVSLKQRVKNYNLSSSIKEFITNTQDQVDVQRQRAIDLLEKLFTAPVSQITEKHKNVLALTLTALKESGVNPQPKFDIDAYSANELQRLEDLDVPKYLFHRYRYLVYPEDKIVDEYPPCVQVELTSICNFRCTFCYQSDPTFTDKKNGFMGTMSLDVFKNVIDQLENNVEFLTFASRGEPLVAKDFNKMLEYTKSKFLSLKLNTNASLLREEHIHTILNSGISTVVFSADAANQKDYERFRVNGSFDKTVTNIKKFQDIKNREYPNSKMTTRVSGVLVDPATQDINEMNRVWGEYVEQVSFVNYSPWEKIYTAPENDITTPCSDLWRRMFIWFDGGISPCDNDYKANLKVGKTTDDTITKFWTGDKYNSLRNIHLDQKRKNLEPCKRCIVF